MSTSDPRKFLDQNIATAIHSMAAALGRAVIDGRRTCITCANFQPQMEICALANARPPATVIAFGCNAHEDKVPF